MHKPFRAHLVEQQTDFEYKLCSIENIHNNEMIAQIKLALGRYGLVEMITMGVQTKITDKDAKQFNNYPFMPVFVTKIVLSNPLSSRSAIQSVSLFTQIAEDRMAFYDMKGEIVIDGADAEQHAHPVEVESEFSQSEVGDAHAKSLISDLIKDLASERSSSTIEKPVYEEFVTSHIELSEETGGRYKKGFYVIGENTDGMVSAVGPFRRCPVNYEYRDTVSGIRLSEMSVEPNGLTEYLVEFEQGKFPEEPTDAGRRIGGSKWEIEVVDTRGKTHSVVVTAMDEVSARAVAIKQLATELGVTTDTLMPKNPDRI